MASYKIYFLDFFHKNYPSSSRKCLVALQNATCWSVFIKKVDFGAKKNGYQRADSRGTIRFLVRAADVRRWLMPTGEYLKPKINS